MGKKEKGFWQIMQELFPELQMNMKEGVEQSKTKKLVEITLPF